MPQPAHCPLSAAAVRSEDDAARLLCAQSHVLSDMLYQLMLTDPGAAHD